MRSPASGPRDSATIIASSAAAERLSRSSLAMHTDAMFRESLVKRPLSYPYAATVHVPLGAVVSGAAAVESAADSVVALSCVGGLGWL